MDETLVDMMDFALLPEEWRPLAVACVTAIVLGLPAMEALLRAGEVLAKRTQPTWDDAVVARGLRIVHMFQMGVAVLRKNKSGGGGTSL